MTTDEAIKIINGIVGCYNSADYNTRVKALRMGAEALERHKRIGEMTLGDLLKPLPGEEIE